MRGGAAASLTRRQARAADRVRRAKGAAALAVLVAVGLLSLHAGLPAADTAVRALVAGVAAYFAAWWGAIHIVGVIDQAETRIAQAAAEEAAALRAAELEQAAAAARAAAAAIGEPQRSVDPHAGAPATMPDLGLDPAAAVPVA